ncbi:YjgN family protein [Klebsiella aerogenes]
MDITLGKKPRASHYFVFHGRARPYFFICLVNIILSVITLGIFIPWAWVRSRRYLCENMEVNGNRFAYHGKGFTILLSWLLMFIVLVLLSLALAIFSHGSEEWVTLAYLILLPVMVMKGLSYHANMTSFANIRFGFKCNLLRAWWIMLGLPLLIGVLMVVILSIPGSRLWLGYGINGMLVGFVVLVLLALCVMAVASGVVYSHWLELIGKGASLGKNKFNIYISTKRCVVAFLWAMVILLPFIILFFGFFVSAFMQMITGCMFGLCNENTVLFMALRHLGAVLGGYLFLTIGTVVAMAFIRVVLRNHAWNNLVLGNSIHFRSTLTFFGLAPRLLALAFLSLLTLGLAYPWLKIDLMRYIAANTVVVGEFDSLSLEQEAAHKPTASDKLCSGFLPVLPFL